MEKLTKIKEIIDGLLQSMNIDGSARVNESPASGIVVEITSREAGYLIGRNGENLKALQQLIRALVSRQFTEAMRLTVDINHYQQERLETLKDLARNTARQVADFGATRALPPMNAYERREIHTALADMPGIKTESEGMGEERRIIIKPNHG